MAGKIEVLNDSNFHSAITKGNVVVDFYADWCGPCKIMAPHFEKASEEIKNVKFAKLDVDSNSDTAQEYRVMSIPTTIFFKDGEIVDRAVGALSLNDIKKKIDNNF